MIKVAMIDDEILAITLLENLIKDVESVNVVGKFTSFEEGLNQLKDLKPDVIFLDIEMPGANGIKVAEYIHDIDEEIDIVFVTAYDQYALDAFGVQAVDYLLKPVDKERLQKTIFKVMKRRGRKPAINTRSERQLEAQFLGNFVLYNANNEPVKWRTKKVKELCAYLLHHQESVHKDQIVEDFWPTHSLEKAKSLLHTSMYQLRKELKNQGFEEAIHYIDERYKLHLDITSDHLRLLSALEQPQKDINRIIELYKDDYLAEDQYLWSSGTSHSIRKKVLTVLENAYKESASQQGLEKLIELEPLEEAYRQALIQAFIQEGQITEALHHFKEYEKFLWEEMSEKPSKKTRELLKKYL
ncbi:response regulator [Sutcliffiella rhizosphaerae]|uniref:Protein-glutamate methylesterase/protein-glutamine glutaminase n=1 Tax=Sutcliffiella rhizosphaerae TaxID=2880967 RepID=A0ABM8YMD9_9BACI|nr:response regulator [Sutcliffiella rhizosphaerae]CAG9621133.1 Protein-glutamate methylesterase/protein-glutamine glutaminase [Sutcliffiella rhizosphaerae]